jgi:hypothetical protein
MSATAPVTVRASAKETFSRIYRILTERKSVDQVERWLVAHGFDYTIFPGSGAWHGARENSMAIELAAATKAEAAFAALSIKEMNEQESVILQELPVLTIFL